MGELNRFLQAQEDTYDQALEEIKSGKKRTHWMWFIFPQLKELGRSTTAKFYGIENFGEAEAYIKDPVLGSRLKEISEELLNIESTDALLIMGSPDDKKLRSSMTLFAIVSEDPVFQKVLDKFFDGKKDPFRMDLIQGDRS